MTIALGRRLVSRESRKLLLACIRSITIESVEGESAQGGEMILHRILPCFDSVQMSFLKCYRLFQCPVFVPRGSSPKNRLDEVGILLAHTVNASELPLRYGPPFLLSTGRTYCISSPAIPAPVSRHPFVSYLARNKSPVCKTNIHEAKAEDASEER